MDRLALAVLADFQATISTVALSGKASKNFSVPSRVLTESGVVISLGILWLKAGVGVRLCFMISYLLSGCVELHE